MEKNIYIEELRHERLKKTIDLVRELEYSEPDKLSQIYMYKVITQDEYDKEQRLIRHEYKAQMLDPRREVARMETKRGKINKR